MDASANTTTGQSLEDCPSVGPNLQVDLLKLLIRFRFLKIAMCADIANYIGKFSWSRRETFNGFFGVSTPTVQSRSHKCISWQWSHKRNPSINQVIAWMCHIRKGSWGWITIHTEKKFISTNLQPVLCLRMKKNSEEV